VVDAWISVYGEQISDEQVAAAKWTSESCHTMYVKVTGTDDYYIAKGTLFSGWRLTTFINTALNYVYLKHSGIDHLTKRSIHNGDDVYAGISNLQQACELVKRAKSINVRANVTKMSIGTIAEFLRVDVKAKDSTMAQYLTRACATFVHGRVETEQPLSYASLTRSYNTRADEVVERGGNASFIRYILRKQHNFCASLFNVDRDVARLFLETDEVAGGPLKDGSIRNYCFSEVQTGYDRVDIETYLVKFDSAIGAYTAYMKKILPECAEYITKKQVQKTVSSMFNFHRTSVIKEPASRGELYNRKAMRGAWKGDKDLRVVHKIRQGITNTIAVINKISTAKAKILSKSGNPVMWLGILTK
jgi:hypothetical protein